MKHKNLYNPLYGVHVIGTKFSPTVNMYVVRNLYNFELRLLPYCSILISKGALFPFPPALFCCILGSKVQVRHSQSS